MGCKKLLGKIEPLVLLQQKTYQKIQIMCCNLKRFKIKDYKELNNKNFDLFSFTYTMPKNLSNTHNSITFFIKLCNILFNYYKFQKLHYNIFFYSVFLINNF